MKLLMIDDHTVVRKGICQLLSARMEIDFDEASSGQEGVAKVSANSYDVVLLDISMPGRNGLEVLKQIKTIAPKLPVLIFSMHPEEHFALRALKNGASGYLTKDCEPGDLITALQQVLQGKRYLSSNLHELVLDSLTQPAGEAEPHSTLSDREFQIASMIASGKQASQIAEELSLSVQTISTYRARLLTKMNLKTNAELTAYFIRHELV